MKPEVLIEMARDWANIKRRQACDILGSPEASELLADAKKFDLVVDTLKALTAQAAPAVPQGWKLVPVEPTSEMLSAVGKEMSWCNPVGIFRKMLAATPAAPSQPAVPQGYPVLPDYVEDAIERCKNMPGHPPVWVDMMRAMRKALGAATAALREKGQA